MTLRIKRFLKRGGTIKPKRILPRDDFISINNAMIKYAPGMESTGIIQPGDKFVIHFDASNFNPALDKELKKLRNVVGLDFDYYLGESRPTPGDVKAINTTSKPGFTNRLFIEFQPRNDVEWSRIREIFGLPSNVTNDVSSLETIETVGDR